MSIPVLTLVYDELRRLAIAGSVVAPGDFRLKKLLPQLEQAGAKAPVFAKVAEAAGRLVESDEKTSAAALLELTTLVGAILYTQGETGIEGELEPVQSTDLGLAKTQASARVLKPLLEALTTTGSGRLEIIRDAHQRGAFRDLRLIGPALAALDDTYAEIGDFVAKKILPLYGQAILPELKAKFDPKGRSGDVRRLVLMHRLDPAGTREIVQRALDDGSKEVRIAAIECLGNSPEDLPFLLEQVKAKAKEVRSAAFRALGSSNADGAVQVLCNALGSADFAFAIDPIRASRNPALTGFLLEAADKQFQTLMASKEKDAKKLGKLNERMVMILECLRGRDDKKTEKLLLDLFGQSERLAAVKGEPSGKDAVERLVSVMAAGSPKAQSALVDAHAALPVESLGEAFVAACRCRKPAQVFDQFSPYLTAKVNEKKKHRDANYAKREAIVSLIVMGRSRRYYDSDESDSNQSDLAAKLDPRWLDLGVRLERFDLVQALAVPGHAKANDLLLKFFKQRLAKSVEDYELLGVLETMIRVRHPDATDAVVELIKKRAKAKRAYASYWLGHLIPRLPKDEALPKLEALLPTLPEKMIDELLDYVTELKNSP
ncbi:MAG: HEAT repeat domain-containing protein [Pirellulales bacterium]|nr:HEAT repeat domain-containing protein [Pirellulales bacterium]